MPENEPTPTATRVSPWPARLVVPVDEVAVCIPLVRMVAVVPGGVHAWVEAPAEPAAQAFVLKV